jgi:hypothetical protein
MALAFGSREPPGPAEIGLTLQVFKKKALTPYQQEPSELDDYVLLEHPTRQAKAHTNYLIRVFQRIMRGKIPAFVFRHPST